MKSEFAQWRDELNPPPKFETLKERLTRMGWKFPATNEEPAPNATASNGWRCLA